MAPQSASPHGRARLRKACATPALAGFAATATAFAAVSLMAAAQPAAAQDAGARGADAASRSDDAAAPAAGGRRNYIGLGAAFAPEYPGAEDYEALPLPQVDLRFGERFFVNSRNGAGLYFLETQRYALGASVYFRRGRDQDDSGRLNGLGDIDTAAQLRAFGRYSLGRVVLGATLAQDLGGSDGLTADLSASVPHRLSERFTLTPTLSARYGDDDYMSGWFGVSPAQSARSGLAAYDAGSGFHAVTGLVSGSYQLSESWSTRGFFGASRLLGDAADSPVVEEETQFLGGVSVGYSF